MGPRMSRPRMSCSAASDQGAHASPPSEIPASGPPDKLTRRHERVGAAQLWWLAPLRQHARNSAAERRGLKKLLLVGEGGAELSTERQRHQLAPGDFTWLDSDQPFELRLAPGAHLLLQWPAELLARRHPGLDTRLGLPRGAASNGEHLLAQLLAHLAQGPDLATSQVSAATSGILELLGLCPCAPARDVLQDRVARAAALIEQTLADAVPHDVARAQGVSRRYLDGLFRAQTGASLAEHIAQRRLERAAADLVDLPDSSCAEIAHRWGFASASHFTRRFRAHYGLPPARYRRRATTPPPARQRS